MRLSDQSASTNCDRQHTYRPTENPIAQYVCALLRRLHTENIEERQIMFLAVDRELGVLAESFKLDPRPIGIGAGQFDASSL
jgi:hypothetical protein